MFKTIENADVSRAASPSLPFYNRPNALKHRVLRINADRSVVVEKIGDMLQNVVDAYLIAPAHEYKIK